MTKLTEGNIFEEIDYAYHTIKNLSDADKVKWANKRYGTYNSTKVLLVVSYIEQTVKRDNDRV